MKYHRRYSTLKLALHIIITIMHTTTRTIIIIDIPITGSTIKLLHFAEYF